MRGGFVKVWLVFFATRCSIVTLVACVRVPTAMNIVQYDTIHQRALLPLKFLHCKYCLFDSLLSVAASLSATRPLVLHSHPPRPHLFLPLSASFFFSPSSLSPPV